MLQNDIEWFKKKMAFNFTRVSLNVSVHHTPSTGKADVIWRMFEGKLLFQYCTKIKQHAVYCSLGYGLCH